METIITLLQILGLLAVVSVLLLLVYHLAEFYRTRNIPGIAYTPLPLFGHSLLALNSMDRQMEIMMDISKTLMMKTREVGLAWLGPKPLVLIVGAKAAETILKSSTEIEKAFLYFPLKAWLGDGLLTTKGAKWRSRRRLLTPTFHFSILKDFFEVMNEQAKVFICSVDKFIKDENAKYFDVAPRLTLCALDIICETAMGKKINAQTNTNSEYVSAIHRATELVQERQKYPWLWPDLTYNISPHGRLYAKTLNIMHSFTRKVVEERWNESKKKDKHRKRLAFMDMLITASEGGSVLSLKDIQAEVDTFMFEGHDTTASAMTFALFIIGNHAKEQEKIYQELENNIVVRDGQVQLSFDNLKKLEYLEAVIKECLRMFPSVPIIGRKLSADTVINGHIIPKGMDIVLFLVYINNNVNYWHDYDKFKPERFLAANSSFADRHPYSFVPFSAGPRNCIGQKFAMMEIKVILAHILLRYKVNCKYENLEDIKVRANVVLKVENGVEIKLTARNARQ